MPDDLEEIKFCGLASTVALEVYEASFDWEPGLAIRKALYRQYLDAGSSGKKREWLRTKLAGLFPTNGSRPRRVQRAKPWPFHDGKPMIFIGQLETAPGASETEPSLISDAVYYVFAARVPHPGFPSGTHLVVQVVTQYPSLP
jgi:hypothetical protein